MSRLVFALCYQWVRRCSVLSSRKTSQTLSLIFFVLLFAEEQVTKASNHIEFEFVPYTYTIHHSTPLHRNHLQHHSAVYVQQFTLVILLLTATTGLTNVRHA